jgi:hypothetical protein
MLTSCTAPCAARIIGAGQPHPRPRPRCSPHAPDARNAQGGRCRIPRGRCGGARPTKQARVRSAAGFRKAAAAARGAQRKSRVHAAAAAAADSEPPPPRPYCTGARAAAVRGPPGPAGGGPSHWQARREGGGRAGARRLPGRNGRPSPRRQHLRLGDSGGHGLPVRSESPAVTRRLRQGSGTSGEGSRAGVHVRVSAARLPARRGTGCVATAGSTSARSAGFG